MGPPASFRQLDADRIQDVLPERTNVVSVGHQGAQADHGDWLEGALVNSLQGLPSSAVISGPTSSMMLSGTIVIEYPASTMHWR